MQVVDNPNPTPDENTFATRKSKYASLPNWNNSQARLIRFPLSV